MDPQLRALSAAAPGARWLNLVLYHPKYALTWRGPLAMVSRLRTPSAPDEEQLVDSVLFLEHGQCHQLTPAQWPARADDARIARQHLSSFSSSPWLS